MQHGQHNKSCPSFFRMCALGTCRTRNVTAGKTLPMAPAYVVKVSPEGLCGVRGTRLVTELDLYPVFLTSHLSPSQGPKISVKRGKENTIQGLQKSLQLFSEMVSATVPQPFFFQTIPLLLAFLPSFLL